MKLSTRGRYAVMAMADMAQEQKQGRQGPFRLSEIAERQEISLSYLEQIFGDLRRAKLVNSQRGAHGGYGLAQNASDIRIGDVIGTDTPGHKQTECGSQTNVNSLLFHLLLPEGPHEPRFLIFSLVGGIIYALSAQFKVRWKHA